MKCCLVALLAGVLASAQNDPSEVCFARVGCFPTGPPWNRPVDRENNTIFTPANEAPPPRSPELLDNKLTLFNRKTGFKSGIMIYLNQTFQNLENLNCKQKIIMVPHGYDGYIDNDFLIDMRRAILNKENVNLLMLSWGTLTGPDNYAQSVSDVRVVGAEMARAIQELRQHCNHMLHIELLSLSIGVPLIAYIGKTLKSMGAKPVQRITGMDPVGIGFEGPPEIRLANTDAEFVVVIHTDCYNLGTSTRQGDVDFFVNDCTEQPGCRTKDKSENQVHSCNHLKAVEFYSRSLSSNDCTFWGQQVYNNPCQGHSPKRRQGSLISACKNNACSCIGNPLLLPARGDVEVDTTKSCNFLQTAALSLYEKERSLVCSIVRLAKENICKEKCSSESRNLSTNR